MKKLLKEPFFRLFCCLFFGLFFGSCAPKNTGLVIVHFNDTHSHMEPEKTGEYAGLGGVIERAAFVDSVRAANGAENVLLLHAGDFSQGTSYFTELHGDIEVEMLNALAYDCTCLGNHEFDNGLEELARRLASVKCPVVCCNYDFSPFEAGKYIKPWAVVEKAGMRIGVIGVLTDITSVVSRETADRLPRLDEVAEVNKWAAYLHDSEHCDYVICLTHVGQEPATEDELSDQYLAVRTRGIDLFVGGHSHTFLKAPIFADNLDGVPVPIVTDGCWGLNAGELTLSFK